MFPWYSNVLNISASFLSFAIFSSVTAGLETNVSQDIELYKVMCCVVDVQLLSQNIHGHILCQLYLIRSRVNRIL